MRLFAETDARRVVIEMGLIVALAAGAGAVRNVVASREHRLSWLREERPKIAARARARAPENVAAPAEPRLTPVREERPSATVRSDAPAPATIFAPHPEEPYVELAAADVDALFARSVLFIDARRTSSYEEGHIPGSRSMPVGEADIKERLVAIANEGLDMSAPVVLYCSGGHCGDSYDLAERLWGVGFNNLYIYKDGFPDWVKRARPVHRGATP